MRKHNDALTEAPDGQTAHHGRPDFLMELLDWLKYILFAVLLGLLIVTFVVQRNSVVGHSMDNTLNDQDQLIVEKVSKWFNGIHRGDIITITTKGLPYHDGDINIVKRVIGIPGDTIEIKNKAVYRNGEKISEPYLRTDIATEQLNVSYNRVTLDQDQYYVLGDNRGNSTDSRVFGPVDKNLIIGEVLLRVIPLSKFGVP
jgi:signal peptidase I